MPVLGGNRRFSQNCQKFRVGRGSKDSRRSHLRDRNRAGEIHRDDDERFCESAFSPVPRGLPQQGARQAAPVARGVERMYGTSTSGRGAAGTSGGSLVDDGPVGVDGPRNNEFAARGGAAGASSAAPTGHGGHGDGSIFSTSSGLYQVGRLRTGSSYAGSAHGGSQSGRKGERRSDVARHPPRGVLRRPAAR